MRKFVLALGILASVAAPLMANATVTPVAINTVLLEDTGPTPMHVKKRVPFLPLGLGAGILATGIVFAFKGRTGNSPG